MFAILYRWRLQPGMEEEFRAAWADRTRELAAEHGGLGSRLHRAEDGTWVAYAQWPDRETRGRAFGSSSASDATRRMGAAVAEELPAVYLDVVEDLLER